METTELFPAGLKAKTEKVCLWQSRSASSMKMMEASNVVDEALKEGPVIEGT